MGKNNYGEFMENILKILILSFGSATVMFILTKIMGNKELSQLTIFDYIIAITIGSIAAEMSTSLESDFMEPLVAMIVYALISIVISILSYHSLKIRKFFSGNTIVLYDNGMIYNENLKKAKLDLNEFLMQCRLNGYFNVSDIQSAFLEVNGKISFLPIAEQKPVSPKDMNISVSKDVACVNIIVDGKLLKSNLYYTKNDEIWLEKQLNANNVKVEDIFLAYCDSNNKLVTYKKNNQKTFFDYFD